MNALDAYLTEAGINNAEFAVLVKSSESSISRLRRGQQSPSFSLLTRIAAATSNKVTPNDFLVDGLADASPAPVPAATEAA